MKTPSVFERISVDGRPKRIHINAFSNKNASVWTWPYSDSSCNTIPGQHKPGVNVMRKVNNKGGFSPSISVHEK